MRTLADYQALVERYRRAGSATNDYLQREAEGLIARGKIMAYCGMANAFMVVTKPEGKRLYYYLNDFTETIVLPEDNYVTEILFRGDAVPAQEVDYLKGQGFSENLIRDNYTVAAKDAVGGAVPAASLNIRPAATVEEVQVACELFNRSFDTLSGDYVDESQYADLLSSRAILVAKANNGAFCGALHQTFDGSVAWISHIAVVAEMRGQNVGGGLVARFFDCAAEMGAKRFSCWVQRKNTPAVALYLKRGFRHNGKSTLSLVKIR